MRRPEQLGPFCLNQWDDVFPLTGDTLALGRFATVRRGDRVCDLGCGSGALLLMAAERCEELMLAGVDQSCAAVANAKENLEQNGLHGAIWMGDVSRRDALPNGGSFDLVLCNPPYYRKGSGKNGGTARMEHSGTIEDFIAAAAYLLQPGGRLAVVHRADRLTDLLCLLRQYRLEPKRMKLLLPAVLVEAVKCARPGGLKLEE